MFYVNRAQVHHVENDEEDIRPEKLVPSRTAEKLSTQHLQMQTSISLRLMSQKYFTMLSNNLRGGSGKLRTRLLKLSVSYVKNKKKANNWREVLHIKLVACLISRDITGITTLTSCGGISLH